MTSLFLCNQNNQIFYSDQKSTEGFTIEYDSKQKQIIIHRKDPSQGNISFDFLKHFLDASNSKKIQSSTDEDYQAIKKLIERKNKIEQEIQQQIDALQQEIKVVQESQSYMKIDKNDLEEEKKIIQLDHYRINEVKEKQSKTAQELFNELLFQHLEITGETSLEPIKAQAEKYKITRAKKFITAVTKDEEGGLLDRPSVVFDITDDNLLSRQTKVQKDIFNDYYDDDDNDKLRLKIPEKMHDLTSLKNAIKKQDNQDIQKLLLENIQELLLEKDGSREAIANLFIEVLELFNDSSFKNFTCRTNNLAQAFKTSLKAFECYSKTLKMLDKLQEVWNKNDGKNAVENVKIAHLEFLISDSIPKAMSSEEETEKLFIQGLNLFTSAKCTNLHLKLDKQVNIYQNFLKKFENYPITAEMLEVAKNIWQNTLKQNQDKLKNFIARAKISIMLIKQEDIQEGLNLFLDNKFDEMFFIKYLEALKCQDSLQKPEILQNIQAVWQKHFAQKPTQIMQQFYQDFLANAEDKYKKQLNSLIVRQCNDSQEYQNIINNIFDAFAWNQLKLNQEYLILTIDDYINDKYSLEIQLQIIKAIIAYYKATIPPQNQNKDQFLRNIQQISLELSIKACTNQNDIAKLDSLLDDICDYNTSDYNTKSKHNYRLENLYMNLLIEKSNDLPMSDDLQKLLLKVKEKFLNHYDLINKLYHRITIKSIFDLQKELNDTKDINTFIQIITKLNEQKENNRDFVMQEEFKAISLQIVTECLDNVTSLADLIKIREILPSNQIEYTVYLQKFIKLLKQEKDDIQLFIAYMTMLLQDNDNIIVVEFFNEFLPEVLKEYSQTLKNQFSVRYERDKKEGEDNSPHNYYIQLYQITSKQFNNSINSKLYDFVEILNSKIHINNPAFTEFQDCYHQYSIQQYFAKIHKLCNNFENNDNPEGQRIKDLTTILDDINKVLQEMHKDCFKTGVPKQDTLYYYETSINRILLLNNGNSDFAEKIFKTCEKSIEEMLKKFPDNHYLLDIQVALLNKKLNFYQNKQNDFQASISNDILKSIQTLFSNPKLQVLEKILIYALQNPQDNVIDLKPEAIAYARGCNGKGVEYDIATMQKHYTFFQSNSFRYYFLYFCYCIGLQNAKFMIAELYKEILPYMKISSSDNMINFQENVKKQQQIRSNKNSISMLGS